MAERILEVENLVAGFRMGGRAVRAVNGVSLSLDRGEVLAIVGESGSGKSVTMRAVLGILPVPPAVVEGGRALFDGRDLLALPEEALRRIRGRRIAMIFQDAMTALNPVLPVGFQIAEMLEIHEGLSRGRAQARAVELLDTVGIPEPESRSRQYPHQFSGGMRQRAMIAMAIACKPEILIADEPTTALDVTIQAEIIDLVLDLQQEMGMAVVWISHDLGIVARIADRVLVLYGGRVMEEGDTESVFVNPSHPYTQGLMASLPRPDRDVGGPDGSGGGERLASIPGQPPSAEALPPGCPFAPRCPLVEPACEETPPPLVPVGTGPDQGHRSACRRWEAAQARGLRHDVETQQ